MFMLPQQPGEKTMSNLQNKLTSIASEQEKKQRKDKLLSSLADVLLEKDIGLLSNKVQLLKFQ
jgi:signal recognition particle GTPase